MKSRVIFASLILGLGIAATASAATTFSDDSPATSKPSPTMLTFGSEKQFAQYIESNFARFSRRTDWQSFMQVVTVYNQNPVAVLSLDADARTRFNEATVQLSKRLVNEKSADANRFLGQVAQTSRMINYLWSTTQTETQPADDELIN